MESKRKRLNVSTNEQICRHFLITQLLTFEPKTANKAFASSVTNLFLKNQVQAKFLSSTLNAFLWDNFQIYQVQKI